MPKSALASMFVSAFLAVIGLLPFHAMAQTTTATIKVNTDSQATQLVDKENKAVSHGYLSDHPFWVNLAECKAGWKYRISVSTLGTGSADMQVWATTSGGDCAATTSRFGTAPNCWRVGFFGVNEGTSAHYIPLQRIVGQHTFSSSADATSSSVPEGTLEDCDTVARSGIPRTGVGISLFFYIFGGTVAGQPLYSTTWGDAGYDLIGPAAPGTMNVRSAESELYVTWSQVLDSDLAGYRIYCQPCQAFDAGPDICAQYAGADASAASCENSVTDLIAGCLPADRYLRGSVTGKLATSGIAEHLDNRTNYGCGVATFDTRQNSGNLSRLQTGKPWPVDDFFTTYRKAGGKGGGGFCSIGQRSSGLGLLIPLASLALLALRRGRDFSPRSKRTSA